MTTDLFHDLTSATGALAALSAFLVAMGFVRLAFADRGPMGHFAAGLLLVHLAVCLRTIYRDIVPGWFGADPGTEIFGPGVHAAVLLAFNAMVLVSGYHSLKALYLTIPEDKRGRYHILTAPLYPPWRFTEAPQALWRRVRGRRG